MTLRFLVRRPGVFTIAKSAKVAHVEEIAGAGEVVLSDDEVARIDAAFPLGPESAGLPRL